MTEAVTTSKPKRMSKGNRIHARRMKAKSRETATRVQASPAPSPAKAADRAN
jgi:hypothetical protein